MHHPQQCVCVCGGVLFSSFLYHHFVLCVFLITIGLLLFLLFSRDRVSLCSPRLTWNSLCRPGWPWTQKSACLCLPSAGIKGVCHQRPALSKILKDSLFCFVLETGSYAFQVDLKNSLYNWEWLEKSPASTSRILGSQACNNSLCSAEG